jgi:hypothetical protein
VIARSCSIASLFFLKISLFPGKNRETWVAGELTKLGHRGRLTALPSVLQNLATIAWDTADTLAVIGDVPAVAGRNNDSCGEIGHVNRGARWFSTQKLVAQSRIS